MREEDLRVGAFGDRTRELHVALSNQGFEIPAAEMQRGFFGPGTQAAVRDAQAAMGLPATGVADIAIAAVLAGDAGKPVLIAAESGSPVSLITAGPSAVPPVDAAPGAQPPSEGGANTGEASRPGQAHVSGTVVMDHGLPAASVALRLYQRGPFGARMLLGQSATDRIGNYGISYTVHGPANIEICAVGTDGREYQLSKTRYAAQADEQINLIAPGAVQPPAPEFGRLADAVAACTDGKPSMLAEAVEEGDRRDFTDISAATGWDVAALALASEAFTNESRTQIPAEGLYALGRAGLPTDAKLLAQVSTESVANALRAASAGGIIDPAVESQTLQAFVAYAADYRFSTPITGALSSPHDFLQPGLLSGADRAAFAGVIKENRTGGVWNRARAAGVTDDGIAKLQLQGKLAYLTFNNARLTGRLLSQISSDPIELIGLGYYEPAKWRQDLDALADPGRGGIADLVPPAFRGQGMDGGVTAYTSELARRVRQMDTHAVTVDRIAQGKLDGVALPGGAGQFLKNAAARGFRLGRTPLSSFLASNEPAVWTGVDESDRDRVAGQVRTLSSLYAISPDDESMNALLLAGFSSATQIAKLDAKSLHDRVAIHLRYPDGGDPQVTETILWRARQQSATVFNVFDGLKRLSTLPYAPGSSPADLKKRNDQVIKTREKLSGVFPTMETLFGSADYCDCEQCQSVLSPAAYLVDLLRFIDPPEEAWETIKASYRARTGSDYSKRKPFDVLDGRRPDIKNIALTCENTNVALPYIDIANEVLEQLVVSEQSPPHLEAYDVGEASTQDLIAEPQNILWSAYVGAAGRPGLRDLVYPNALPFDLPLEMVRAFLDRLDLPLWRLRELLARPATLTATAPGRADGWADVWFERLGLGAADVAALTRGGNWYELFGYDSASEALRVETSGGVSRPHESSLRNGKTLARRLDVSYLDLVELLRTRFVNPEIESLLVLHDIGVDAAALDRYLGYGQALTAEERAEFDARLHALGYQLEDLRSLRTQQIRQATVVLESPSTGCDFARMYLAFSEPPSDADAAMSFVLRKMNLLVQLQRRLGWDIHDVDRALLALMPGVRVLSFSTWQESTKTFLIYLAHAMEIADRLSGRLTVEEILIFWSDIPTEGVSCLYERLFLSHAVLGRDPAFAKRLGRVLQNPAAPLRDHLDGVSQALGLAHDDIETILTMAGAADRNLSVGNLSILMRYASLARGLDISIPDLVTLLDLSARQPLAPLAASPLTTLAQDRPWTETLGFLREAGSLRDAGADAGFLDRVCRRGGLQEEPPADSDPLLIALVSLPESSEAPPEKRQVLLVQTLAAQMSASEALIQTLLTDVLTDSSGRPLAETGFSDAASSAGSLPRLRSAVGLVTALGLAEEEIVYLQGRSDALDLNDLPAGEVTPERAREIGQALGPWLEMSAARKRYTNRQRLLAVLNAARQPVDATSTPEVRAGQFRAALAALTGFEPAWLAQALDAIGAQSADGARFELPAFADPARLHTSIESLRALIRLRLDPHDIVTFAGGRISDEVARKVRASLKGRYSASAWRRLVQPAYDKIRQRQRDALVARLTSVMEQGQPKYGDTTERLFEYLLLDPGMEPVVLSSRIQLAIAAVQLFVQRCLMNLEPDVDPQIIDTARWQWMSRYRVWEANRKMFIMASNWLAPELRDDKTHLFRDLESKLLQADVNDDLVRGCMHTYLKGLEEIARLELLTMYFEPGLSADSAAIHVVGRTPHAPHKYFYRKSAHGMWTPWQPLDIGIEGEHLVLTSWRGQAPPFLGELPRTSRGKTRQTAHREYGNGSELRGLARHDTDQDPNPLGRRAQRKLGQQGIHGVCRHFVHGNQSHNRRGQEVLLHTIRATGEGPRRRRRRPRNPRDPPRW